MTIECGDLLIGNSTDVCLVSLKANGAFVNDATVTVTVKTSVGGTVAGASAVAMPYVALSDGEYKGVLPNTLALTVDAVYSVEVTATKAGVGVGLWKCKKIAKDRECC